MLISLTARWEKSRYLFYSSVSFALLYQIAMGLVVAGPRSDAVVPRDTVG